jgi:hypothetical protein
MSRLKKQGANKSLKLRKAAVSSTQNHQETIYANPSATMLTSEKQWDTYDENLLERTWIQWQFGDWESLSQLLHHSIESHPERARLALLAASGHAQMGDSDAARQFTQLAKNWGASKKLISRILISGVHNSLGRAAALANQQTRALQHFKDGSTIGMPGGETRLLTQARINEQLNQLGLPLTHLAQNINTNEAAPAEARGIEELNETLKI